MMKRDSFYPLYGWLIIFGLILFGGFLLWKYELLSGLVAQDRTYLSVVILSIFLVVCLYLGWCAWHLSLQTDRAIKLHQALGNLSADDTNQAEFIEKNNHRYGWASTHFHLFHGLSGTNPGTESTQAHLVERVHRAHSSGWFLSDVLLRLGLIGTVIGFVLMLGSVYELKQEGIQALQQLLARMGSGMQVALYTTLTGLGAAMLVGIQCHWLDRCADRLVSKIIELTVSNRPDSNS